MFKELPKVEVVMFKGFTVMEASTGQFTVTILAYLPVRTRNSISAFAFKVAHLLCFQIYVKFSIIVSSFPSPKTIFLHVGSRFIFSP